MTVARKKAGAPVKANLGGIGESTLETWAHEVLISPNRAKHDVKGWDYLLTLPRHDAAPSHNPLDQEPPELSCLVQVKATRNTRRAIQVKLSNWERFAKAPLPALFLVIGLDSANKPESAFLVHVGEAWIAKVLEGLRRLSPVEREHTHKRKLSLKVTAADALASLGGPALLDRLRKTVGSDPYAYLLKKKQWLETVGYDDKRFAVTITLGAGGEPDEQFYEMAADFAIGKVKKMPIKGFRASEVRFGVATEITSARYADAAFMEVPSIPPSGVATLEVRDEEGIELVSLQCEIYPAVTIFPFLPPRFRKIALKADGVTFVLTPSESNEAAPRMAMSFELPAAGEVRSLAGAPAAAKLARLLRGGTAYFAVATGAARFDIGESDKDEGMREDFIALATAIENASTVIAAYGVPPDAKIDFTKLLRQTDRLSLLAAIAKPSALPMSMSVSFLGEDPSESERAVDRAAVISPCWLTLGDTVLLVILAFVGEPHWATDQDGELRLSVSTQAAQVPVTRVLKVSEAKRLKVRPLVEAITARLKNDGIGLVVGPPDERRLVSSRKTLSQ